MSTLNFVKANKKIAKLSGKLGITKSSIYAFNLPSGYTCRFAKDCKAYAKRQANGKTTLTDAKDSKFRCYSASMEARLPNVYDNVWNNFQALRKLGLNDRNAIAEAITESLPKNAKVIRIHVSGDYFSMEYMEAWNDVALQNPSILFYGYTKAFPYLKTLKESGNQASNFRLTYSIGGMHDPEAIAGEYVTARVVFSEAEAEALGLQIDNAEVLAVECKESFALLIHGTQPAGSDASIALQVILSGKSLE